MRYFYMLLTFCSLSGYGQIEFEPGYFINNNQLRSDALIKNEDWNRSPSVITYKLSEDAEPQQIAINDLREFGIGTDVRYVRCEVDIDQSTENLQSLSNERNPIFTKETVMLKQLVKGSANLYSYVNDNRTRYFFNKADGPVKQLIYKKYYQPGGDANSRDLRYNNFFQSQLYQEVNCKNLQPNAFEKMVYKRDPLVKYFQQYNSCSGDVAVDNYSAATLKNKPILKVNIVGGVTSASVEMTPFDSDIAQPFDFGNKIMPTFGAELEYVLAFNRNKWSVFVNPMYSKYNGSDEYNYMKLSVAYVETLEFKTSIIDIPVGLRHYMFINNHSRIFVDAAFIISLIDTEPLNSQDSDNIKLDGFKSDSKSYAVAIGYSYKRISAGVRLQNSIDLDNYVLRETVLSRASLLLKYQIL